MPELPEVEVVRRGLAAHVVGRTITAVRVNHPRAVRRHAEGPADLTARLLDNVITGTGRRGKYLWLTLGSGEALVVHLGMSGQMLLGPPEGRSEATGESPEGRSEATGESPEGRSEATGDSPEGRSEATGESPEGRSEATGESPRFKTDHLRVATLLDDGTAMSFVDQRTFGGWMLADLVTVDGTEVPVPVAHVARDPLDPLFDGAAVVKVLRRKHSEIKRQLLDQTVVSGIGNIYADESLWRAKVNGARIAESLTKPALAALLGHAADVMRDALGQGGTSFDSLYVNVNGESGYFDRSLDAYGREGEPCRRCGAIIQRDKFMNRSSYYCPKCQPRPRR
jgi:formamidopyrimidine-DNA glycosylase